MLTNNKKLEFEYNELKNKYDDVKKKLEEFCGEKRLENDQIKDKIS